jgi:hypothetical protein
VVSSFRMMIQLQNLRGQPLYFFPQGHRFQNLWGIDRDRRAGETGIHSAVCDTRFLTGPLTLPYFSIGKWPVFH